MCRNKVFLICLMIPVSSLAQQCALRPSCFFLSFFLFFRLFTDRRLAVTMHKFANYVCMRILED